MSDDKKRPQCVDPDLCDWRYDSGDDSVGYQGGWVCRTCDAVDCDREPPSDLDADAYERNL